MIISPKIFFLSFLVFLFLIVIYNSLKPEKTVPFSFNPFTQEAPTALPDPTSGTSGCWNKLTPCDSKGECSACDISEYECKNITNEKYTFNGINVPQGKWCLPKHRNKETVCNPMTGRWVWTYDPEYCFETGGGSQCWKCECLYPNLFTNPKQGCEISVACQNDSIRNFNRGTEQKGNFLQATKYAPKEISGCVWGIDEPKPECKNITNYTPYDKDSNGNPYFACVCGNSDNQKFINLPNDPYTCHLEPCSSYIGSTGNFTVCDENGNCSCSCPENFAKSPNGKFENECVLISGSCGSFGFNSETGQCTCGEGPYWERTCKSSLTGVNEKKNVPECVNPENALGSECYNPCEDMDCLNDAPCISCGKDSYKTLPSCRLAGDGSLLSDEDASQVHAKCLCELGKKFPNENLSGFHGDKCQFRCLADGTELSHYNAFGGSGGSTCDGACCCSGRTKVRDTSFWGISSVVQCDGDYPTPENPAVILPINERCADFCDVY